MSKVKTKKTINRLVARECCILYRLHTCNSWEEHGYYEELKAVRETIKKLKENL